MRYLGFEEPVRASHHPLMRKTVVKIVNIQSRGGPAKYCLVGRVQQLTSRQARGVD